MSSFKGAPDNVALLLFFVFWYAGNMKYNEYNTSSLNAVGGKTAGMTMIVATMQLGVCAVYALVMWAVKINPAKMFGGQPPAKQDMPKTTQADLVKTVPKSERVALLRQELRKLEFPPKFQLALDPRFECAGLKIEKCKTMDSKKVPLWLHFVNADPVSHVDRTVGHPAPPLLTRRDHSAALSRRCSRAVITRPP